MTYSSAANVRPSACVEIESVAERLRFSMARSIPQVAALRADWVAFHSRYGIHEPDALLDSFIATIVGLGEGVVPYVAVLRDRDQIRGIIAGRTAVRSTACRLGYLKLSTARLRCLDVVHGGILTDRSSEARDAIWRHLQRILRSGEFDQVVVHHLAENSDLFADLCKGTIVREDLLPHRRMKLIPGAFEESIQVYSSKHRRNLRRDDRLLVEHFNNDVEVVLLSRENQLDEVFKVTREIARKTYQQGLGVALEDNSQWRATLTAEAKSGRMRCFVLRCAGKPIAFQLGVRWGAVYRMYFMSYLAEFRKLSPGAVLHVRVMRAMCEEGAAAVDYGFGDAEFKRSFSTESWNEASFRGYGNTWRGWTAKVMIGGFARASRIANGALRHIGLTEALKKMWRSRLRTAASREDRSDAC
jgi:hypothetical protein